MSVVVTRARTIRYGPSTDQSADLYLPAAAGAPVVCLVHGGFWRMPYGRDEMAAVADDLAACGFAVWNMEYRRLGSQEGGWPNTLDDVTAGIDHLARVADGDVQLDLDHVIVVGHSAGGHLALCEAGRRRASASTATRVHISAAVGLAPIADLAFAHHAGLGRGAVSELIGGPPDRYPERYRSASPSEMLPLGVRQLVLHGSMDDVVPVESSRRYVSAARAAGDPVEYVELADTGHMEFLDPASEAHAMLRRWLVRTTDMLPNARCISPSDVAQVKSGNTDSASRRCQD